MVRKRASWCTRVALGVVPLAMFAIGSLAPPSQARVYRGFSPSSYWNTPLPRSATVAKDSKKMIRWLIKNNSSNYIQLGGTTSTGAWGMPIYWGGRGDPRYNIHNNCSFSAPPEFDSVRIPLGAEPDSTSDSELTVYNKRRGRVFGLWKAQYDTEADSWSACGGTVYYLRSNGLHGSLRASDERRNRGHRGFPPPTFAVRYDEIKAREIRHVLKIAVDETKCSHVFPAVGDECGTRAEYAPPEGTRIRIKPSVDLQDLRLSRAAVVIAKALQRYGAVIGDQSGGAVAMKVENTIAEGRGYKWDGVLRRDSLRAIPLRYFQVISPRYRP